MPEINRIIAELKRSQKIDLSGYKRNTLKRRIASRMARLQIADAGEYLKKLQTEEPEGERLIDHIAINVSSFFRNPVVFEIISANILPEIIRRKRQTGSKEVRVWSAGCGKGEEAYSIAILIHQAMENVSEKLYPLIFATEIDRNALKSAVSGVYPRESFENTKLGILDSYFTKGENSFAVKPFIKELVQFSYDDLLSPGTFAPAESVFGSFDIVLCRNVLIYYVKTQQNSLFLKIYRSLAGKGYLVLGESENLNDCMASKLNPTDIKSRIFQK